MDWTTRDTVCPSSIFRREANGQLDRARYLLGHTEFGDLPHVCGSLVSIPSPSRCTYVDW
jgi:hypothetical protein